MRLLILALLICCSLPALAQDDNWMAPEGFTLNNRTINWEDFKGKMDRDLEQKLAARYLQPAAYVCPAIYFTADSGERLPSGRIKLAFHGNCAFQSRAFVRESTKKEHSNYILIHEQDHYDIALVYTDLLEKALSSRDYSEEKIDLEIDKIYDDIWTKYRKTQETYDNDVNPDGDLNKPMQYLWDMRIKKCLENNTDEYYQSPESALQSIKLPGQVVKRKARESALQFVVRARPLYTEFPADMKTKVLETDEWGSSSILAFYTQKYYVQEDGAMTKDNFRTLAYLFVPTTNDMYKRILIDTFTNGGSQVNIGPAFFANADSDQVKELVIMATAHQKDNQSSGTVYINRVYDNIALRPLPVKVKRFDEKLTGIESGMEGIQDGKPVKAKYKTKNEIIDALKKKYK